MDHASLSKMAQQAEQQYLELDREHEARDAAAFPANRTTMMEAATAFVPRSITLDYNPIDAVTSYLGSRNPFYHYVDAEKHKVWLLDNTAYQPTPFYMSHEQPWCAEFTAAYFVKNSGRDVATIAADIAEKLGLGEGDEAEETIRNRLQPLLDTILPAHAVDIDIPDHGREQLGPSGRDGISLNVIKLGGGHRDGEVITSKAVNIECATDMTTTFATRIGWAVISDVDDTIKRTQTSSPLGILRTTFVDEPEAIPGMPELYKRIDQVLQGPPWWYLSASPYNLYPFLRTFRNKHFPPGPLILREASWMNIAGFLACLTQGTQRYKAARLETIHRCFPHRKFLCIGDSTQTDPESYAELYKKHPGWIAAIWIRRVRDLAGLGQEGKVGDERFERVFLGVPREVWRVFDEPSELDSALDELAAEAHDG